MSVPANGEMPQFPTNNQPQAIPIAPPTYAAPQGVAAVAAVAVMPQKPPKKVAAATGNKVIGAKIILQFMGEDGVVHEATTTVDPKDFKVQKYSLDVDEKHEKKRDPETKDLVGFEDTGERVLVFKLRYHVR